jgi:methyl-accepting chemotaxis protein
VFVASKRPLDLPSLSPKLLDIQQRLDPAAYIGLLESMLAEQRVTLEERAQLIQRLHVAAGEQAQLIQNLHTTAEERAQLIQRLHVAAGEQARLIQSLHTTAAERLGVIEQLDQVVRKF